mgnify:CR=1 FL=1
MFSGNSDSCQSAVCLIKCKIGVTARKLRSQLTETNRKSGWIQTAFTYRTEDLFLSNITEEIKKRRTFAIISHPDAGKTTLTEKFLLYGGAIHNWPERKDKLFKNEYIQIAYDHLDTLYGESKLSAGL